MKKKILLWLCMIVCMTSTYAQLRRYNYGIVDHLREIRNTYRDMRPTEAANAATALNMVGPAEDKANSLDIHSSNLRPILGVPGNVDNFVNTTSRVFFNSKYPIAPIHPNLIRGYNQNFAQNIIIRNSSRNFREREWRKITNYLDLPTPGLPPLRTRHMAEGERIILLLDSLKKVMKRTLENE